MTEMTFRELYLALETADVTRGQRPLLLTDLLLWAERLPPLIVYLQKYMLVDARLLSADDIIGDLWRLYALSRVDDYLLWPFQPGPAEGRLYKPSTQLSLADYCVFWEALRMQIVEPPRFHPFWCEITAVIQSDDPEEPITICEQQWPALQFGSLLISRAGVTVRGGINHIQADVAARSTLYFTYRRRYRQTKDLSMGWGTNSQWRTTFRRDYVDDQTYYYNVDGALNVWLRRPDANQARAALSASERYELLVNRCFIVSRSADSDLWPYDDTATEAREL